MSDISNTAPISSINDKAKDKVKDKDKEKDKGKNVFRFIHCADFHLESALESRFDSFMAQNRRHELISNFARLSDYAQELKTDAILICGDLFDTPCISPSSVEYLIHNIEQHSEIQYVILPGNHDGPLIEQISSRGNLPENLVMMIPDSLDGLMPVLRIGKVCITGIQNPADIRELSLIRGEKISHGISTEGSNVETASQSIPESKDFLIVMFHGMVEDVLSELTEKYTDYPSDRISGYHSSAAIDIPTNFDNSTGFNNSTDFNNPADLNTLTDFNNPADFNTLTDIDYLAAGHIHSFQEGKIGRRGIYCYSGCLEGRGFDECGPKGFILADISFSEGLESPTLEQENSIFESEIKTSEDNPTFKPEKPALEDNRALEPEKPAFEYHFVPFARRELFNLMIDASEMSTYGELSASLSDMLKDIPVNSLVRINLTGTLSPETNLHQDWLYDDYSERFYYFVLEDHTSVSIQTENYEADISLKGAFIRLVLQNPDLTEEDKEQIIRIGLNALSGEEIITKL